MDEQQLNDRLAVMGADIRAIQTMMAHQPSIAQFFESVAAVNGRTAAAEHRLETHDGDIRELKSFNDRHRDKFAIAGFLVAVASSALTALIVKLIMR